VGKVASSHRGQEHHGVARGDGSLEAAQIADVLVVYEHVDETAERALRGKNLLAERWVAAEQVREQAIEGVAGSLHLA
jgi:hypothetical protein